MADFMSFIGKERKRLDKAKSGVLSRMKALEQEIADIESELEAIAAYDTAKRGKATRGRPSKTAQSSGRVRGKRRSRQGDLLDLLSKNKDGLSRGEILQRLGLKGDKSAEQSISNALSVMKKKKLIAAKD